MNYKNVSTGLKTHVMTHKNKIEIIKVQLQSNRNEKKIKIQKKLGASNKNSPEYKEQYTLDATVAWVIE